MVRSRQNLFSFIYRSFFSFGDLASDSQRA